MDGTHTNLLYQKEGTLRQHTSKLLTITPVSTLPPADQSLLKEVTDEDHALITDETIFYVQGGGQPSDTGKITISNAQNQESQNVAFEVSAVRHPASGTAILHFGRFTPPISGSASHPDFHTGAVITQQIDGAKRDLHSRLHTAGHILGLAINALCRKGVLPPLQESKASHYPGSAAVEFIGLIDGKMKDVIQAKTDEFVATNAEVCLHWWSMERLLKDCEGVADGFDLPEGETLGRVVEMVGLGAYPCGGTHVLRCGEVGKIEVRKIARVKGVSRVSYRVL